MSLRQKGQVILAVWIALFLLGCANVGSRGGAFPLHAYPHVPKALSQPHEVWIPCSNLGSPKNAVISQMICVDEVELLALQGFVRELDSIVRKYEYAIKTINKAE
jgi:hypothetical protein